MVGWVKMASRNAVWGSPRQHGRLHDGALIFGELSK